MRSSANASPSGNTMKSSRPTSISIIQRNGIIAALVVAIAWLVFKTQQSVPEYSKAYATGSTVTSPFYDFAVNDIEHRPYDLNQLRGKVMASVDQC